MRYLLTCLLAARIWLMPDFQRSVSVAVKTMSVTPYMPFMPLLLGRVRGIGGDLIWTDERQRRTYGNEERYFYVSYGVLAEFLRMNVILTYFATETATATDTERWKSGIMSSKREQQSRFRWEMTNRFRFTRRDTKPRRPTGGKFVCIGRKRRKIFNAADDDDVYHRRLPQSDATIISKVVSLFLL